MTDYFNQPPLWGWQGPAPDDSADAPQRAEKPPLGIEPEHVWKERRALDLMAAIIRNKSNRELADKWMRELKGLLP